LKSAAGFLIGPRLDLSLLPAFHRDDEIDVPRPAVGCVGGRRVGQMIRVGMVEPDDLLPLVLREPVNPEDISGVNLISVAGAVRVPVWHRMGAGDGDLVGPPTH